ncbi:hypothetical protein MTR67_040267 [Solanum verrucosum]|uniref:Uncharacterized protein n=1 Tax=Solanum verrucosum TaxID=315347 RepID=A0AAF0UIN1_SOLVR|nr:hypothetical protein MTR67_040267 [Solanum verrucosum]
MLLDVLIISSQVQGPGPLQSMFVQDYMLYSWQAVTSAVVKFSKSSLKILVRQVVVLLPWERRFPHKVVCTIFTFSIYLLSVVIVIVLRTWSYRN